jgi:AcrR family transcriptional regulator
MAYEVIKTVNGRPYRYRVRSERDAETGKFRNRWTYLGRADANVSSAPVRPRRNARTALLDGLERLLLSGDPEAVTAAAISTEAGVAHGTFYRYFRNKNEAIVALFERLRSARQSEHAALEAVPESAEDARRALRGWLDALLREKGNHAALMRVLLGLAAHDEALAAHQRTRRVEAAERLRVYLVTLDERGFVHTSDAAAMATVLVAMIGGIFREAILREPLDDARIAAAIELIEAAVFARAG